jgi:hypothetical protein
MIRNRFIHRFWSVTASITAYGALDSEQPSLTHDAIFWEPGFARGQELLDSWKDGIRIKTRALRTISSALMSGKDGGFEPVAKTGWTVTKLALASAVILVPYRGRTQSEDSSPELALRGSELIISGRWTEYVYFDFSSLTWSYTNDFTAY